MSDTLQIWELNAKKIVLHERLLYHKACDAGETDCPKLTLISPTTVISAGHPTPHRTLTPFEMALRLRIHKYRRMVNSVFRLTEGFELYHSRAMLW
jgi:hypothetical protein